MGCRANRNILFCYVDTDAQTFLVYIREMMLCLLRVLVGHVKTNMVDAVNLHLLVYGTSHDVARSKAQAFVVFLHE